MIADGNVFVVGQERLVGAEELADAGGVVDGGVEVGVVGDVDGFDERGAGDGVEGGFGCLSAVWFRGGWRRPVRVSRRSVQERGRGPSVGSGLGPGRLRQGWGEQIGCGAGVEVEQMSADGDAEVLLAFELEGSVGEMGQGKVGVGRWLRGASFGGRDGWLGHGE